MDWGAQAAGFLVPALLHPRRVQCIFCSGCSVEALRLVVTRSILQLSFVHSKWVSGMVIIVGMAQLGLP